MDAGGAAAKLKASFGELHEIGLAELQAEGFKKSGIRALDFVDLRYRGQSYELTVPLGADFIDTFHKAHERRYGYSNRGRTVELVNVRTTFLGRTAKPLFKKAPKHRGRP